MKTYTELFRGVLKDTTSTQLLLAAALICGINLTFSWFMGSLLTLLVFVSSLTLSAFTLRHEDARIKVQSVLLSILALKLDNANKAPDADRPLVSQELDSAIESLFKRIIDNFVSSWYSQLSRDETFIWNVKKELAEVLRKLSFRLRDIDYPALLSNKLLPVAYSHLEILDRIVESEGSSEDKIVKACIDNENHIHQATFNRISEVNFLRCVIISALPHLVSRNNVECQVLLDLLNEILTCSVLLPLMDVLADPATVNSLVILATNGKVQKVSGCSGPPQRVVLLESFTKQFQMSLNDHGKDQSIDTKFLKDQEKLYNFMQHLKSKSNNDIDLLRFFLDVEHLNAELEKMHSSCDPFRLTELQSKSEKLLKFYQTHFNEGRPLDLYAAHNDARSKLEAKYRNDFYKSAEYFQLIYGDKEGACAPSVMIKALDSMDAVIHHQKFASRLKSAMSIRTGAVEGLEATEIPIWDALDHPLGQTSYYNSVAVKLRKERGQDLDGFMQSFYNSIEQEADVGEDIAASTQAKDEEKNHHRRQKIPNHLGNVELYRNLFNLSRLSRPADTTVPFVKTTVDSAIYFLASVLNIHTFLLRLCHGIIRILPDAERIILGLIRKLIEKNVNETLLAKLIGELEEKIFDAKPTKPSTNQERELAEYRLLGISKGLGKVLSHLQNPIMNKHLIYCIADIILIEIFPELNTEAKGQ